MKNFIYSKKAKYLALLLAVLCGVSCIGSAFLLYFVNFYGLYDNKWSEVQKNCYENVQQTYAMKIFEEREENPGCLDGTTNMEYGVISSIRAGNTEYEKLRSFVSDMDKNEFSFQNFKTTKQDEYTHVMEFNESDVVNYNVSLFGSLLNSGWRYRDEYTAYEDYLVEQVIVNIDDGFFYFETDGGYIPIQKIYFAGEEIKTYVLKDDLSSSDHYVEDTDAKDKKILNIATCHTWEHVAFGIEDFAYNAKNIAVVTSLDVDEIIKAYNYDYEMYPNSEYDGDDVDYYNVNDSEYMISVKENNEPETKYWIISSVKDPLDESKNDLFVQQKKFLRFLYDFKYTILVICVISFILFFLLSIYLIMWKGDEKEDIHKIKWYYRMPLFFYLCSMGFLIYMDVCIGILGLQYLLEASGSRIWLCLVSLACVAAVGIWLVLLCVMNVSYRFYTKILWKYSILRIVVEKGRKLWHIFCENTALIVKALLAWGGLSLMQLFVIAVTDYRLDLEVFLFMLYKFAEIAVFFALIMQMKKLQDGSKKMAQGDLESKIDTQKMSWELKKHGEYLNQISDGMSIALQERMKSERFKTELITNVSHDIKTPLTSIINYVDLMKREEISEPVVREYLEVLENHSGRLKKLIEDLMEASKASTGNLTVNWEPCDIDILLTQVIGEFEEKTEAAGLELIINKQEESVYIMADNRHLWRILENLMNNICKYAQSGTRVYINQEIEQEMVRIILRNTSKYPLNISAQELLERFVRGDVSRNTEGSGLGLSIAQNLAELLNGTLQLHVDGDLFKVVLCFPKKS